VNLINFYHVAAAVSASSSSIHHDWIKVEKADGEGALALPLLSVPAGRDTGYQLGQAIGQAFADQIKVTTPSPSRSL